MQTLAMSNDYSMLLWFSKRNKGLNALSANVMLCNALVPTNMVRVGLTMDYNYVVSIPSPCGAED